MFTQADADRQWYFLLDLTWAGSVYRLAEYETEATIDGEVLRYNDGLSWGGNLDDVLSVIGAEAATRSIELTLFLNELVDIPAMIARGHMLGTATGELYVYSTATGNTVQIMAGKLIDPAWDEKKPVIATLEESAVQDDRGLHPDRTAKVNEETFPTAADFSSDGEWYPTVLGAPVLNGTSKAATPGLYIGGTTSRYIVIAGHVVEANAVRAYNMTQEPIATIISNVVTIEDSLGRKVAAIDADDFGSLGTDYEADDTFRIDWHAGNGLGIVGAGDVLLWMLEQSTVRWDRGRIEPLRAQLNLYRIDTYIMPSPDDPGVSPMDWIRDNMLPILPVVEGLGPDGWYIIPWRLEATEYDAKAYLEVGRNCERVGDSVLSTPLRSVANEIKVNYSNNSADNKGTLSHTITGDSDHIGDASAYHTIALSMDAVRSVDSYGEVRRMEVSTSVVSDPLTASLVAGWLMRRHCCQSHEFGLSVASHDGFNLAPGDVVVVTDTGRGFTDRVGVVTLRSWNDEGDVTVGVMIPAWDLGTAG